MELLLGTALNSELNEPYKGAFNRFDGRQVEDIELYHIHHYIVINAAKGTTRKIVLTSQQLHQLPASIHKWQIK